MLVGVDNLGGILRRENCVSRGIYMLRAFGAWIFQFSDWVRWAHTVRLRKSAERMEKKGRNCMGWVRGKRRVATVCKSYEPNALNRKNFRSFDQITS
jgi:hypothetical protein